MPEFFKFIDEFFSGRRRRVGLWTLILALIFMVGWMRSLIVTDRVRFGEHGVYSFASLGLVAIVLLVAIVATCVLVRRWYENGWNDRPGTWTFITPQLKEDRMWDTFVRELRKEPRFQLLKSKRFRGVNWLEGSLESKGDLDRLIALAKKCGIENRNLDGPYQKSISILIPGTERSVPH